MKLAHIFLNYPFHNHGGEQDYHSTLHNVEITAVQVLSLAEKVLETGSECRVGVLETDNGQVKTYSWTVKRVSSESQAPPGSLIKYSPKEVQDIEDDMEISINLPSYIAVFRNKG